MNGNAEMQCVGMALSTILGDDNFDSLMTFDFMHDLKLTTALVFCEFRI